MRRHKGPLNVMIVEDEALLAIGIEAMVQDSGHQVIAEAASLYDIIDLPDDLRPHLAFVDMQLAQYTNGLDVARLIQQRWADAIIVFVTANPLKIPADFGGAHGVIPQPLSRNGPMSAMRCIEEGVCDPAPVSPQPSSFVASSAFAALWNS
jgi:DNA-binding LytR/AlgR family response regulator